MEMRHDRGFKNEREWNSGEHDTPCDNGTPLYNVRVREMCICDDVTQPRPAGVGG